MQRRNLFCIFVIPACAPVEMQQQPNRAPNMETQAGVGDVIIRFDRREPLPNAFGRADIFGRTRNRGFVEVRYMGLGADGRPVFRRRDVEILSNETTMTATAGFGSFAAQGSASGFSMSGASMTPAQASVAALPPDTIQFALNPQEPMIITVGEARVVIIQARADGVRFRLEQ